MVIRIAVYIDNKTVIIAFYKVCVKVRKSALVRQFEPARCQTNEMFLTNVLNRIAAKTFVEAVN
jgi:hypothetical protein